MGCLNTTWLVRLKLSSDSWHDLKGNCQKCSPKRPFLALFAPEFSELVSNTSSSKFYASELRTHLTTMARTTWKLCEKHVLKWQHHLASPLFPAEVLDRSKPVRIELDQPPRKNSPRVRTLQRCGIVWYIVWEPCKANPSKFSILGTVRIFHSPLCEVCTLGSVGSQAIRPPV